MIVIHLFTGLVFGVTSVIFSIYADHSFLTGLLRYSAIGSGGMLLSAALSLIPIGAVLSGILSAFRSVIRGETLTPRTCDLSDSLDHGGFQSGHARKREV